jgi:hypothetical protein
MLFPPSSTGTIPAVNGIGRAAMAFQMDVEVSGDALSLRVEFLTRRMHLGAAELDNVIFLLAQARALISPPHAGTAPPEGVNLDASDMHWFVGPHPDPGPAKIRLGLRHPGHGWITAPLSPDIAERLERQLRATRLALASTASPVAPTAAGAARA